MSKKLLEESTIRSFMKLANLKPLSEKFISEKYAMEEEKEEHEEDEEEDKKDKKKVEEGEALEEEALEEVVEEEGDAVEEGKESEGRPASPKAKVAGVAKPGKMDAAKNAAGDAKLKPAQKSSHHSDKPDTIETKGHSNAPKKNNSQFEVVSESLEEEMDGADAEATPSDTAGEGGDHQDKMKELIRSMLGTLKDMGAEYGMSMEISDEGGADAEETPPADAEMAPPEGAEEDEGMMQEKLDEMVEKLTKRVAARLVKESKKKR
jgi:hypothetical protein